MKVVKFEFSLFGINSYIVYDPATLDCAVIDPGMISERERNALVNFINKNNLKVVDIINTHLHIDHSIGNSFTKNTFNVPVLAHQDDIPLGSAIKQQAVMFGMNESVENVTVDSFLKEGDVIKIGDGELQVIHVPGHSPGSVVLYDKEDGFLIAGDVLFRGSVGRSDLPGGNHSTLINGIKEKLLKLPDNTVVYPGHGPSTTIGEEKLYNPFL